MIIFFGKGRLGNQLFQYAFIKNFSKPKELIITSNFAELLDLFKVNENILNIKNKYLNVLIKRLALPILRFCAKRKIISSYKVNKINIAGCYMSDTTYSKEKGFLPIKFIYPGYFQGEVFFSNDNVKNLKIKEKYLDKARSFLKTLPANKNKLFVHVRQTDYKKHSCFGIKGVALPLNYYFNQIKWLEEKLNDCFFIFLTDDNNYVKEKFRKINNKVISENSMFVDFAIMTLCDGGIMSNSTFSWWGGYFNNKKFLIAPEYWLGFKSKKEYPKGITPSFARIKRIQ
jgi:hypothetical protein